MTTNKETLRENWLVEAKNVGALNPEYIADWWIEKLSQRDTEWKDKFNTTLKEIEEEIREEPYDESAEEPNSGAYEYHARKKLRREICELIHQKLIK